MSEETRIREEMCEWARSMFERGLTNGSSGNISARLSDGRLLVSPTGTCFGKLDPARLAVIESGQHVAGDAPTKEMPLHSAFYETRKEAGAVVHIHATHSVALSMLEGIDPDNVLPPLTAYSIMRLGKVKLLPVFLPGDPKMGEAIRGLAGKHSAVLFANHGPVVAGRDVEAAVYAMEELEETARLALLTHGLSPRLLNDAQVQAVVDRFNVDWQ